MRFLEKFLSSKPAEEVAKYEDELSTLQRESADLIDEIQALKLDISELQAQNDALTAQLHQSKFHQNLVKTGLGLLGLVVSYGLLTWFGEQSQTIVLLLGIEALFVWFALFNKEN
ncbi:MAG TPA: hypothetical protein VGM95_03620 [Lactobacillaceae bacterium]|jgi:hypothetical protein